MEEKIITESKSINLKRLFRITFIILTGLLIAFVIVKFAENVGWYNRFGEESRYAKEYPSATAFALHETWWDTRLAFLIFVGALFIEWLYYAAIGKMHMTVTNKRVYGKSLFGKRVDLPFDSITAVAVVLKRGIAVSTASGRIKFRCFANRDDLFSAISNLLVKRQDEKRVESDKPRIIEKSSNADELRKYKDLLDSGIITQEEFDAKKKQILGL